MVAVFVPGDLPAFVFIKQLLRWRQEGRPADPDPETARRKVLEVRQVGLLDHGPGPPLSIWIYGRRR
jgi:hypothetical protein